MAANAICWFSFEKLETATFDYKIKYLLSYQVRQLTMSWRTPICKQLLTFACAYIAMSRRKIISMNSFPDANLPTKERNWKLVLKINFKKKSACYFSQKRGKCIYFLLD
jgi:hypothetical protein